MRKSLWVIALLFAAIIAPNAHANEVTFATVAGSDSDGPLAATVSFTSVSGGIDITLTNTETGTLAKGQAVSDLSFTVSGLGTVSGFSFTQLSGNSVDSADFTAGQPFPGTATVTAFDNTGTGTIDHWGFSTSGSVLTLETAGSSAPPMNPMYMILPSSGTTGSGSSLAQSNFDPYILGPGTFFLTDSTITAGTVLTGGEISDVSISFGTGFDKALDTTVVTPEPASMLLYCTGLLIFGIILRRRLA